MTFVINVYKTTEISFYSTIFLFYMTELSSFIYNTCIMQVFERLEHIENTSLALGFFDGVHLGHRAVINSAINNEGKTVVITFKKSPAEYFSNKEFKYINTVQKRRELIEALGVDYLFELYFTKELAEMSPENYIKNVLVEYFKPLSISTGFNHTFGRDKLGNTDTMSKFAKEYNYKYFCLEPQKLDNEIISSTKIRQYIQEGNIEKANKMLGYNFSINGEVIHGNEIGRTIGFPTANMNYPNNIVELPYGVYSSKTLERNSMTNYGIKPTINNNVPIVETHILNFEKNLYNKDIEVEFVKRIRSEKKFDSLEELKEQINKDILEC